MKNIIIAIFTVFIFTSSNADELTNKISNIISDLIPGEGTTEVSVDLRENHKPDYSILGVREIDNTDNGNLFTQFSLFNTEKNNSERTVGNIGFGQRMLSDDNTMMTGYNVFWDYDSYGNSRTSFGLEARNAVLDFAGNYYLNLGDGIDEEKPLEGYDLNLASQVPYMHWADVFLNAYEWFGRDRDDIKGTKLGSELLLSPNLNLELAYDDKDKKGLEDEWYARVMFVYPPRSGPSLQDGFLSESPWKEEKDMSGELLSKVKRNNKIVVEFKGTSTISRTD